MKLFGNVEVSGLKRIVFDKTTVYELHSHGVLMWYRKTSPRNVKTDIGYIEHQQMAKNISNICHTEGYRVRFDGDTANIYSQCVCPSCGDVKLDDKVVLIIETTNDLE